MKQIPNSQEYTEPVIILDPNRDIGHNMTPKNANILISGPNRPFGLSMQLLYIDPVKNRGIVKP